MKVENLSHNKTSKTDQVAQRIINVFNLNTHLKEADLKKIYDELVEKYNLGLHYLDSKFLCDVLSPDKFQATSRLWELIMVNYLIAYPAIKIEHSDAGPDWKVKLTDDREYYIEATCAGLPKETDSSEIHRVLSEIRTKGTSSSGNRLIEEVKSRISNRIYEKMKNHTAFMKDKKCGYILLISYGEMPFFATCSLENAVKTVYPLGNLTLQFTTNQPTDQTLIKQSISYQENYIKPSLKPAQIMTNILGNEEYKWVSAILFSKVEVCLLLRASTYLPNINWKEKKNDFVLIHNPVARYPLSEDLFDSNTIVTVEENKLTTKGENIFTSY